MAILLNPRVWIALGCAAVLAFVLAFTYRAGKAVVRNEFDAYKLQLSEAKILADRAREHERARRQAIADQEAQDGQKRLQDIETQLADARLDGERMRSDYDRAAQRARKVACAAPTGTGEPGPDPISVFAGLLERAENRAEQVAGYAEKLRSAGLVCERAWDKMNQPEGVKLFK